MTKQSSLARARRLDLCDDRAARAHRELSNDPVNDASLGGRRLADYLTTLPIDSQWIAGHPVIWQTGQKDGPESADIAHSTHCSAFVAAVSLGLNIYLLRPHRHKLKLLSNAQVAWFLGSDDESTGAPTAEASGWGDARHGC